MPLRQLIEDDPELAFSPEELEFVVGAFEDTLSALELRKREDPLTLSVARCILNLAKGGECDPVRLRMRTLAMIRR
jgi:hypothetical protein